MSGVPILRGGPRDRGLAFARLGAAHHAAVSARAAEALAFARAQAATTWLETQWAAQQRLLPDMATFVEGLAEGHGLAPLALFAGHARSVLEDRMALAAAEDEGCSAFAITRPGFSLLAKNRDNPPALGPLASLVRQADPAWGGRTVLSIGSFGSCPSASSGINSDGFCMADTAVRTHAIGPGALRYYVMQALLACCGTVDEALRFLGGLTHLGGGTLLIADATGTAAAVELAHGALHLERAGARGWVARTNHFLHPALARTLRERPGSAARANSEGRLAELHRALGTIAEGKDAIALLSRHAADNAPALCRHGSDSATMSCAVFDAAARSLRLSVGAPCSGAWITATPAITEDLPAP